jgi:hydroxymethylglutaryl-CoA lyase
MQKYPDKVIIEEQGLRDGLQNENGIYPLEKKLEVIDALVEAGIKRIQLTSFVHPQLMPQMADAEEICKRVKKRNDVLYSGLALNTKGIQRAADVGLNHVAASISASDTHSRKNASVSLAEARKQFAEMVKIAKERGLKIRGELQCVFGCRFEGKIDYGVIFDIIKEQLDLGVDEIALADSTGMANPISIQEICEQVILIAGGKSVFLHLHDTEGKGLANALAAMQIGVYNFDTAFGGMGGCPFIKEASGNISTEDFAFMLHQMGIESGIDIKKISAISRSLERFFDKRFSGKMHNLLNRKDIKYHS